MVVVDNVLAPAPSLLEKDSKASQTISVEVVRTVTVPGTGELKFVRANVSLPYK
jgi:hypothetical protein